MTRLECYNSMHKLGYNISTVMDNHYLTFKELGEKLGKGNTSGSTLKAWAQPLKRSGTSSKTSGSTIGSFTRKRREKMLVSKEDIENMQTAASDPNVDALMIVDKKTGELHQFVRLRTTEWLKLGNEVVCSSCWHSESKYKYKDYKWCPYCGAKIIGTEGRE